MRQRFLGLQDIYVKDVDIVLGVLIYFAMFAGGSSVVSAIRYSLVIYLFIKYVRVLVSQKTATVLIACFTTVLTYSTWANTGSTTWAISALMFGMQLLSVFALFIDNARRLGPERLLRRILGILLVFLVITDMLIMLLPYDRSNSDTQYLIGNKFIVSYAHCFALCIARSVFQESKRAEVAALGCAAAFISYYVDCTTGVVMMLSFVVMHLLPTKVIRMLSNPFALALFIAGVNLLIWGTANIFESSWFQSILVNVLHESPDMTGRSRLYDATLRLVEAKPWLGYGYLTNIYRDLFGYGNAQNGVFHIVTQAGIIGAMLYFGGLAASIARGESAFSPGLYLYLYSMAIGSTVEINLSMQFVYGVALLCAVSSGDNSAKVGRGQNGAPLPDASTLVTRSR